MNHARAVWSGLLVSVRDAAEAAEAVAGGAAIVDVKEPERGPLGAATAAVAAAVATAVGGRAPWTLACGELAADGGDAAARVVVAAVAASPPGTACPAAAKAGPAGLTAEAWRRAYRRFAAAVPVGVEAIAVAYADWRVAAAPEPDWIVAAAAEEKCRTLLIDTFDKSGAGILHGVDAASLPGWISSARAAGMAVAVAGRLDRADIPALVSLGADVIAIRSAACAGGRLGRVERNRVAAAAGALSAVRAEGFAQPFGRLVSASLPGRRSLPECHAP